jgi:hypothetical protein
VDSARRFPFSPSANLPPSCFQSHGCSPKTAAASCHLPPSDTISIPASLGPSGGSSPASCAFRRDSARFLPGGTARPGEERLGLQTAAVTPSQISRPGSAFLLILGRCRQSFVEAVLFSADSRSDLSQIFTAHPMASRCGFLPLLVGLNHGCRDGRTSVCSWRNRAIGFGP